MRLGALGRFLAVCDPDRILRGRRARRGCAPSSRLLSDCHARRTGRAPARRKGNSPFLSDFDQRSVFLRPPLSPHSMWTSVWPGTGARNRNGPCAIARRRFWHGATLETKICGQRLSARRAENCRPEAAERLLRLLLRAQSTESRANSGPGKSRIQTDGHRAMLVSPPTRIALRGRSASLTVPRSFQTRRAAFARSMA